MPERKSIGIKNKSIGIKNKSIGIKKLAATLDQIISLMQGEVIITRSNKPVAVLIGYEEYEKLLCHHKQINNVIIKED